MCKCCSCIEVEILICRLCTGEMVILSSMPRMNYVAGF